MLRAAAILQAHGVMISLIILFLLMGAHQSGQWQAEGYGYLLYVLGILPSCAATLLSHRKTEPEPEPGTAPPDSRRRDDRPNRAGTIALIVIPTAIALLRHRLLDDPVLIPIPYMALVLLLAAGYGILMLQEANRHHQPAGPAEVRRRREFPALAAIAIILTVILTAYPMVNWPLAMLAGVMAASALLLYRDGRPPPQDPAAEPSA